MRRERTLPLLLANTGARHGVGIVTASDRRYELQLVFSTPSAPEVMPEDYEHRAPELGRHRYASPVQQKQGRQVLPFQFEPGDPLGEWVCEVWIDGALARTFRYQVVARRTDAGMFSSRARDDELGLGVSVPDGWITAPREIARGVAARRLETARYSFVIAPLGKPTTQLALAHLPAPGTLPPIRSEDDCTRVADLLAPFEDELESPRFQAVTPLAGEAFCSYELDDGVLEGQLYVAKRGGRLLVFDATSRDAGELPELRSILDSLEFR